MRSVDKGVRYQSGVLYILPETPLSGVETASDKVKTMFCDIEFEHPIQNIMFKCGLRRAIRVFAGQTQKDASTDEASLRIYLRELRDALK